MVQEIITWTPSPSDQNWREINKTRTIYLAYDCELIPLKITDIRKEIISYCREHNAAYSIYPPNTFSGINDTNE